MADVSRQRRLSINLSDDVASAIDEITRTQGISITEAIRRAVSLLLKIQHEVIEEEGTIIVERQGRPNKELVFVGLLPEKKKAA